MQHHEATLSGYFKNRGRRAARIALFSSALVILPASQQGLAEERSPVQSSALETGEVTDPQNFSPPQPDPVPPPTVTPTSIAQIFSADTERDRNIFLRRTRQSVSEFRALRNDFDTTGTLTRVEQTLIDRITAEARDDARRYDLPLPVAASLRFAAELSGTEVDHFMQRLTETGGIVAGGDPAGLMPSALFKFNVPGFLYMMKNYGGQYGFSYLTDGITVTERNGAPAVHVEDPALLRHIIALRNNPRVSALMGAEYIKNADEIPPVIGYHGAGHRFNAAVLDRQNALATLGFDLGIRRGDGISGPLTMAATREFLEMSGALIPENANRADFLEDILARAVEDSNRYTNRWNNVTPENAFAIRHASQIVGADFSYMMELASAESGFGADARAGTSSATGLYQFIEQTWLVLLHRHGEKHGLGEIAGQIDAQTDRHGRVTSARIEHPFVREYALSLRTDRRIAALIAAEFVKENHDNLRAALPRRNINRTDQYMAHFLGSGQAVRFLRALGEQPDTPAATLFATEAASNPAVFYNAQGDARSVGDIYARFQTRFDTQFFQDYVAETQPPPSPRRSPRPMPRPRDG
ncbi:MAG: hypothetical protein EA357_12195 [Micavibrio sp.]|nr:MAG: hypothetical protein EA357_12195 [Micavibrio sp.]